EAVIALQAAFILLRISSESEQSDLAFTAVRILISTVGQHFEGLEAIMQSLSELDYLIMKSTGIFLSDILHNVNLAISKYLLPERHEQTLRNLIAILQVLDSNNLETRLNIIRISRQFYNVM